MKKLEARLMTCHRGHEDRPPEETGGYMPIEPYEILNADETIRALVKSINYNSGMSSHFESRCLKLENEVKYLEMKLKQKYTIKEWIKSLIK